MPVAINPKEGSLNSKLLDGKGDWRWNIRMGHNILKRLEMLVEDRTAYPTGPLLSN